MTGLNKKKRLLVLGGTAATLDVVKVAQNSVCM